MAGLFQFSEAVSLALHGLKIMARNPDSIYTAKDLARNLKASEAHLTKVFRRLVKNGLVTSHRGPHGGFMLRKKPDEITLLEIFTAIEGDICRLDECPLIKNDCPFGDCIFSGLLCRFQHEFRDFISCKTLEDFVSHSNGSNIKLPKTRAAVY